MSRYNKLSDSQWAEIKTRFTHGESARALGKEYKVGEATIRSRCGSRVKKVREVATNLAEAELALSSLTRDEQMDAREFADEIKAVTRSLTRAAVNNSAVAERLSGMTNASTKLLGEPGTDENEMLTRIAKLLQLTNSASTLGLELAKVARGDREILGENVTAPKVVLINAPSTQV